MTSAASVDTRAGDGPARDDDDSGPGRDRSRTTARTLARAAGRVRTPAGVVGAGLALVVAAVGFRAWVVYPAFFFLDDYVYLDDAGSADLGPAWLAEPYNGHVMPGARLLIMLVARGGPVDWPLAATTSLVLQACAGLAMLWTLVRVFGPRPGVLVPLAVYLSTAITVPGFVWWAAAINLVPVQVALTLAVGSWVCAMRTREPRWVILVAAWVTLGLCFDVRAVLTLPVLAFVSLAYFAHGGPLRRAAVVLGARRPAIAVLAALGGAYTAYYLTQVEQITTRPSVSVVAALAGDVYGRTLPTGILGGPWRWYDPAPPTALADPPPLLVALTWCVLLVVVAWIALRRSRTLRAWVPLVGYVAALVWLVASTRSSAAQVAGLEYRFLTEAGVLLALGLGLATMPLPGAVESSSARQRPLVAPPPRVLVAALTTAVVLGGTWSAATYAHVWHTRNDSEPFVRRLAADLSAAGPVDVAELRTRDGVLSELVFPRNNTRTLAAPLSGDVSFPPVSDDLHVVDDDGALSKAAVDPTVRSAPGPVPGCGWLVDGPALTVPLDGTAPAGLSWLRVGYLLGSDTSATLVAGGVAVEVDLEAGLQSLFVRHNGDFDEIRLTGLPAGTNLCVDVVEVGDLVPFGPA